MKQRLLPSLVKTACLAAASLALCQTTYAAEKLRVAAPVYGLKSEFANLWVAGLKHHPAVKDGTVDLRVLDSRYDPLVMNNQIDSLITQKFDAIITIPVDFNGNAPAVRKAKKAGIPMVASNARINSTDLVSTVISDDVKGGEIIMQEAANRMGGKGNIVIFQGPIGGSGEIDRTKGVKNILAKYPDIKILEIKTGNWSRAEGLALMENWLTAHPGKIKGVIGENDEMALGAIQAIKARGLNVKDFVVVGIDGVPDAINAVKAGEMFSILQDGVGQAQAGLDLVLYAKLGDKYTTRAPIWEEWKAEMPWNDGKDVIYYVPWTVVTPENADALLQKQKELMAK